PPNFVILQLDDLGYDDIGINGNMIVETPNIDSFAMSSIRIEQFYVNPVCAPTRASLLTGRHFMKTGVSHVHGGKDFISLDETLIAEVLKKEGYATGIWGKWHSGHSTGYYPWERGFDEAYMAQLYRHRNSYGLLNGKEVKYQKWADEVITDYAIDFMDRNRDQPFLAYLSFLSIHAPLDTPDSLKLKYLNKGVSTNLATIYGMVEHLDYYLGELFCAMDTMGLNENTIFMFMSDNGPAILNDLLTDEDRKIRYVSGMRGHKGNIWENGVKSPLFVKWQGVTKPSVRHDLVDITDLFPSILKMAGAELPEGSKALDGTAICDLIECGIDEDREKTSFNYAGRGWPPTDKAWSPEGVLDEYRPVVQDEKHNEAYEKQIISVRKGAFKLLHNPGFSEGSATPVNGYVLIDLLSDPLEEFNLYEDMPELANEMTVLLKEWWQTILDEPASFRMPTSIVGRDGAKHTTILANAPLNISPRIESTYAWLTNWKEPGDFAEYAIDVETPGMYEVSVLYKGMPNGATVKASVGERFTQHRIELYDKAMLGSIDLEEGEQVLRLELVRNPAGTDIFDRLMEIKLRKRD
nr:sulfatase-like hydrolase/transferase [Bacteroidales bacterium]